MSAKSEASLRHCREIGSRALTSRGDGRTAREQVGFPSGVRVANEMDEIDDLCSGLSKAARIAQVRRRCFKVSPNFLSEAQSRFNSVP